MRHALFVLLIVLAQVVSHCGGTVARLSPDGECDYNKPFGPREVVLTGRETPNGIVGDGHGASLSRDELDIYFDANQASPARTSGIFVARRSSRTSVWSTPRRIDAVPSDWWAWDPKISTDGLTLYFTEGAPLVLRKRYHALKRSTTEEAFAGPPIALSTLPADSAPLVSPDGRSVYYLDDTHLDAVAIVRRAWDGEAWTGEPEVQVRGGPPVVSIDEAQIYFPRAHQLYYASRAGSSGPFGPEEAVAELGDALPLAVSSNACRLYFATNEYNRTSSKIFVAQRGR